MREGVAAEFEEKELGKVFDARLMGRLWQFLRPYKWLVFLALIMAFIVTAFRVVGPLIARHIIDNLIPAHTADKLRELHLYLALYLGLLFVIFAVNFALIYITAWVGQRGMYDLRRAIFEKIHSLSLRFFDRTPSGRLLTRTTSDVQVLNELFSQGVVMIMADMVLLIGVLIAWFIFDWKLACMLLIIVPLLVLAAYNFRIRARSAYRTVRTRLAALNAYLQENLAGIRTVQAFHREETDQKKYADINAGYRDSQFETVKQFALFFPVVEVISMLAFVIVLIYAGWKSPVVNLGAAGTLTAGDFNMYFQYITWFFWPIMNLVERYNIFQAAMASSERIFVLLDEEEEVCDPETPTKISPLSDGVELHNVWFAYNNEDWVLQDVSMQVETGKNVAIVGATGAGKSTIINLISRLYDVQRGEVLYNRRNVKDYSQDDLRRRIAIVLQDVFLFSGTITDNIRLGNKEISNEEIERAARYVNAHGFISQLPHGYGSEVLERGATLSVGQKQLLAFARAVAFNADLLILDEATANIDTETEALIQDALEKLMHDRTCIIIAHRLSTIQNADKIIVLHHGKLREEGTHQELLRRNGLYRRLYELQYKA